LFLLVLTAIKPSAEQAFWHDSYPQVRMRISAVILLFIALCSYLPGSAQEKAEVEILNANAILTDPDIVDADRLVGDVRLKYRNALMRCDSAYRYPSGDFEAFGNIAITQGDSIRVFGDNLYLERNAKECRLRNNIRLMDKELVLTTDVLNYNFETSVGSYFDGGKIVSTKNKNVLTSQEGFYDSKTEFFHFRRKVVMKNPEYTVKSDTLKYSGSGEVAYFFGPTWITARNSSIYCVDGWYNTISEVCQFRKGATITSGSQFLAGDSIYYRGKSGIGEVFGNVLIRDTTSSYVIDGNYGWHDEIQNKSLVTGAARMVQYFDDDTLFLHADTLRAVPDSLGKTLIRAYRHVKFFKSDLQGKSDSLNYNETDSLLRMFGKPVLWSDGNQISGEKIDIRVFDGKIQRMDIFNQAFIISEAADSAWNQIKGRDLIGYFSGNKLQKIHVIGNGQTIYYTTEKNGDEMKTTGLNRADCSDVMIYIVDNTIQRINLISKPKGALNPLRKLASEDRYLLGFSLDEDNRPTTPEEIFDWNE
jgi:lipopolysaccharide export system protein LptA